MANRDSNSRGRGLDAGGVDAALRRMALAPQPPWLHGEVARRMAQRLDIIRLKPSLIVDWWGFSGAGSEVLQRTCPNAKRVTCEPTSALAERSRLAAQRPWWSPSRWGAHAPDALLDSAAMPQGVQLVWANMMLHAVDDPPALFERWHKALEVDGFVMFSCLGPGTLRELHEIYRRLGWGAPTQEFVDMHDLGDMMVHAGFADPVMDQEVLKLQWSSPQALLAELRTLGGNVSPGRHAGLRTQHWRARLLGELEALRAPDGKISLGFEVAYGHAFKPAPRARFGENTTVSLEEMRAMVRLGRSGV